MKSFIRSQQDPNSRTGRLLYQAISLNEWAEVKFSKMAEFDRADNQLRLIKDKALGLPRSEVLKRFLLPIDARSRTRPENRRALLAYLLTPLFTKDFQKYLGEYMTTDQRWIQRPGPRISCGQADSKRTGVQNKREVLRSTR